MNHKISPIVAAAAMTSVSLSLSAYDLYSWGKGADGDYADSGAWLLDGEATDKTPGNNFDTDVKIDGAYTVTYTTSGDFTFAKDRTLTISNGATFLHSVTGWPLIYGTVVVDNATYDAQSASPHPGQVRFSGGTLKLLNGGKLLADTLVLSDGATVTLGEGSCYTNSGTLASSTIANYVMAGGTLYIGGEFQPPSEYTFTGSGTYNCNVFSPQTAGSVVEFNGPNLIMRTGSFDGFWQAGATYINVPAGSTSKFTIYSGFKTAADVYAKTFGTSTTSPKYRYNGEIITQTQFESLFTVEASEYANGDDTNYADFYLTPVIEGAAEFDAVAVTQGDADGKVEVAASFTDAGDGATVYLVWGASDAGRKIADWGENKKSIGTASTETPISATVEGLAERTRLYFRLFAISESGATAVSDATVLYTRYYGVDGTVNEWIGMESAWTDTAAWSLGHVPADGEIVWVEKSDAVINYSGNYTTTGTEHFTEGKFTCGELTLGADLTLNGFSMSCTTFLPNGHTLTLKKGTFVTNRAGTPEQAHGGVYGNGTVNIVSGKATSYTFVLDSDAYDETFGGSHFTYNSAKIDESTFNSTFTVETVGEGKGAVVTMSLAEISGVPQIDSEEVSYADGKITFTATLDESSPDDTVLTVYYDTSDHEHNTSFGWPNTVTLVKQADGTYKASAAITTQSVYYWLIGAASATAATTAWANGTVIAYDMPTDTNVFLAKSSDVTDTANWSKGTVPGAEDIVELNEHFSSVDSLTWDVGKIAKVGGWKQSRSVTVFFNTTADTKFTIDGDVELTAGKWTHSGPSASPTTIINVEVTGAMTIGANAMVTAGTAKGTTDNEGASRGYSCANGPGYLSQLYGAAHGGDGGAVPGEAAPAFVSYGSIIDPMTYGSGGWGDGPGYAGGGVIKLEVAGTLTVNGTICSRGFGYPLNSDSYSGGAGSGGSVNLTAAALAGAGAIDANGGDSGNFGGAGSGGRVKVELTGEEADFTAFTGKIEARGGAVWDLVNEKLNDISPAAAGTVYLKTAAINKVVVDNYLESHAGNVQDWYVQTNATPFVAATHLPAMGSSADELAALKATAWEVKDHGAIRLTSKARIAALTVGETEIANGTYTAAELNAKLGEDAAVFSGTGTLSIGRAGLVILVR